MEYLGTINVWLVIGLLSVIGWLVWQVNVLESALKKYISANTFMMAHLDAELNNRDAEVDQKIEKLESQIEYMNEQK